MFQGKLPFPDQTTGYVWCDLFLVAVPQEIFVILGVVGRKHPMVYAKSVPFIEGLHIPLNSRMHPPAAEDENCPFVDDFPI